MPNWRDNDNRYPPAFMLAIISSAFSTRYASYRPKAKVAAEPVLDVHGIARWQRARRILSLHLDREEAGA
jgi:hypothetical protein